MCSEKITTKLPPRPMIKGRGRVKEENEKQTFCPGQFYKVIINIMEEHLCTHPLIPGYFYLSQSGIHEWAVKQMYQFCTKNNLWEVWAYLWENWYHAGRWELWAHLYYNEVPVLTTTMILESQ
ncbi:hypothetical protein JVU11DRAFT_9461 [Chiua virens]|nr:hypothetical protein JVU11DRAFT_9461 [Chiua virens]